jgi:hypothetical protein
MNSFCTIITEDYLPFAKALLHSLKKFDEAAELQDEIPTQKQPGIRFYSLRKVLGSPVAASIHKKYAATNADSLRWALKPVFITYLLKENFDKIIYCDPDIFFVDRYDFLFEELDTATVLLSPHWRNTYPLQNEDAFRSLMKEGIFNGGFVAASKRGIPAMEWWAGVCQYKTEKQQEQGFYVDQKYLDVLPLQFEEAKILRHKGCNLAAWNIDTCQRSLVNGQVKINREFDPVFIHFTKDTIANIQTGNDRFLQPFLKDYLETLRQNGFDSHGIPDHSNNFFTRAKQKTLIRTRLKRFFFKLAERL